MRFDSPLVPATLVSRYKRFLFDAVLDDRNSDHRIMPEYGAPCVD